MRTGVAAEFSSIEALLRAIRLVRERGATRLEAYSPFPVHAIDLALGQRRSRLSIAAGIGALCGALGAYALQWYLVAYLYPQDLGARPPHMPLPFLIITIEMGFLFGALAVTIAFLVASRLFKLYDPVFDIPGFESATRDAFWLVVAADDASLVPVLRDSGAGRVATFGGIA